MEGTSAALRSITRKVSQHGTTSLVATTVTASTEQTLRAVEGITGYMAQQRETEEPRAEVLGIHFEGPSSANSAAAFTLRMDSAAIGGNAKPFPQSCCGQCQDPDDCSRSPRRRSLYRCRATSRTGRFNRPYRCNLRASPCSHGPRGA